MDSKCKCNVGAEDRAEIEGRFLEGMCMAHTKDVDKIADMFTDDCVLAVEGHPFICNKAGLREFWSKFLDKYDLEDDHQEELNMIAPNCAIRRGTVTRRDRTTNETVPMWYMMTGEKIDG